jgi:hypothetical protein
LGSRGATPPREARAREERAHRGTALPSAGRGDATCESSAAIFCGSVHETDRAVIGASFFCEAEALFDLGDKLVENGGHSGRALFRGQRDAGATGLEDAGSRMPSKTSRW